MVILKKFDYEFGYEIGKSLKYFFNFLKFFISKIDKNNLEYSKRYLSVLKEKYPEKLERFAGISSSTGIDIYRLNFISILFSKLFKIACTDTFSAPPATSDGKVYLTWNMDIFGASRIFLNFLRLIVIEIPNFKRYVGFGLPILGTIGILNQDGLAYVGTAVGLKDGNGTDGLLDMDINNLCMEKCEDVESVVKLYRENKVTSIKGLTASIFLNLNCIWGDAEGKGVAIEHSSKYIHFEFAKEGILAIANHHQFLDRNLTGSPTPSQMNAITGSYCRLGRVWKLLRENKGNISLDVLKKISSDHILEKEHVKDFSYNEPIDDGTICCHYWNLKSYLKKGEIKRAYECYLTGKTLISYIIEPKDLIIYRCRGNPCRNFYHQYDFKRALKEGYFKELKFGSKIYSIINKNFYRIPKSKIFMNFFSEKILKKILIFLVKFLEKIIKVEVKY
jgi:hypothetical protein